mmetsp:Transcript_8563/g.12682  ORF Transcript_8563/g.12682 Transcript_8563/m.12682 type:complete len:87 (+) Transcript_8563:100-360(+)
MENQDQKSLNSAQINNSQASSQPPRIGYAQKLFHYSGLNNLLSFGPSKHDIAMSHGIPGPGSELPTHPVLYRSKSDDHVHILSSNL